MSQENYKTIFGDRILYTNKFGQLHREDGPAVEYISGSLSGHKEYRINDKLHRLDGAAVISSNDSGNIKNWYYHGKSIKCKTQEEFERLIKLAIL